MAGKINPDRKVIIIGAGMAGIKLAHTLAKKGIKFVVLEASDYVGGRMKSIKFDNHIVEAGANWIHGKSHPITGKTNPIWTLGQNVKLSAIDESSEESYIVRDP